MIVPKTYHLEISDTEMDNLVWLIKAVHTGKLTAMHTVIAGELMRELRRQGVPIKEN